MMDGIKRHKNSLICTGLLLLWGIVVVAAFSAGANRVYAREVLECLAESLRQLFTGQAPLQHPGIRRLIVEEQLPRILAGALVGACLSIAGSLYQGVFQNPKVSPDLLGASGGAMFGAALCIILGLRQILVPISFFFGLGAVALAYLVSVKSAGNQSTTLLLAGVMVSAFFTSALKVLTSIADPYSQLPEITYWTMGSLRGIGYETILLTLPYMLVGLVISLALRWPVNLFTMGEDEARSMGVNAGAVRLAVVLAATMMTSASVALAGKIEWIGLVIPHLSRMLVGYDFRIQLPVSMLLGSTMMVGMDLLARYWWYEIPLNVMTAVVGLPFFLYLIVSRRNRFTA